MKIYNADNIYSSDKLLLCDTLSFHKRMFYEQ